MPPDPEGDLTILTPPNRNEIYVQCRAAPGSCHSYQETGGKPPTSSFLSWFIFQGPHLTLPAKARPWTRRHRALGPPVLLVRPCCLPPSISLYLGSLTSDQILAVAGLILILGSQPLERVLGDLPTDSWDSQEHHSGADPQAPLAHTPLNECLSSSLLSHTCTFSLLSSNVGTLMT